MHYLKLTYAGLMSVAVPSWSDTDFQKADPDHVEY